MDTLDIDGIKRTICDVYGTYWSANKRTLSKVRHDLYFISAFCVVPSGLKHATLSLLLCFHQIIASYAFAENTFWNMTCWLDSQRV
jgi:hypothetical protein